MDNIIHIGRAKPAHTKPIPSVHTDAEVFADRLTRIRISLEKINRLMVEMKVKSNDDSPPNPPIDITTGRR